MLFFKKSSPKVSPPDRKASILMDAAAWTIAEFAGQESEAPWCYMGQDFSLEEEKSFQGYVGLFRRNLDLAIGEAPGAARDLGLIE